MINAMWSALENIASKTETYNSLISTLHAHTNTGPVQTEIDWSWWKTHVHTAHSVATLERRFQQNFLLKTMFEQQLPQTSFAV